MAEKYKSNRRTHRIRTRLAAAHGVETELLQTFLGLAFTVQEQALKSEQSKLKLSDSLAEGLHPALERIATCARNLTDASGAALALGGPNAMVCVARSGSSAPPVGAPFDASSGLSGECIRTGESAICVNASADPRVNYQACRALNVSSMLYFPLRSTQGKMIGMLGVFSSKPLQFSQRDVAVLRFTEGLVQEALGRSASDPDPATLGELLRQADFREIIDEPDAASEPLEPEPALSSTSRALTVPPAFSPSVPQSAVVTQPLVPASLANSQSISPPFTPTRPVLPPQTPIKIEPIFVGRVVDESVQELEANLTFDSDPAHETERRSRIPAILILLVALAVAFVGWNYNRFFGSEHAQAASAPPKTENIAPPASPVPDAAPGPVISESAPPEQALTSAVSLRSGDATATVTILLPKAIRFEGSQLSNPDRIYFDLHEIKLTDAKGKVFKSDEGLISKVRLSDDGAGTTRVVFDLRQPASFEAKLADNPQRLVIELHRLGSPTKASEREPSVPTKVTIVVDPGHGGKDLGTVSPSGLQEKDLTLDVALRLGGLLKGKLGANVIFTRDRDEFVTLDDRVAIANRAHADFMISIHGNSSTVQSVRGVETYYFRDSPKDPTVPGAVEESDMARAFAADVHQALLKGLADPRQPMRDRGVKPASFVVLREAQMPAALAEISFISNRNDQPRLESEQYREQIARSLYKGIANHISRQALHVIAAANIGARGPQGAP